MPSHSCDHSASAVKLVPVSSAGVALVVCGGTFLARWKRSIANRVRTRPAPALLVFVVGVCCVLLSKWDKTRTLPPSVWFWRLLLLSGCVLCCCTGSMLNVIKSAQKQTRRPSRILLRLQLLAVVVRRGSASAGRALFGRPPPLLPPPLVRRERVVSVHGEARALCWPRAK